MRALFGDKKGRWLKAICFQPSSFFYGILCRRLSALFLIVVRAVLAVVIGAAAVVMVTVMAAAVSTAAVSAMVRVTNWSRGEKQAKGNE